MTLPRVSRRFPSWCCLMERAIGTGQSHCEVRNLDIVSYLAIIYRVSHGLRSLLRESVPYVKIYRYNPKHLCPKLNGYGDNGKKKVWTS